MNSDDLDHPPTPSLDKTGEKKLRGKPLEGSDQKAAVDHVTYEKTRDPDAILHLDGETDTLYSDGLDLDDVSGQLVGTDAGPKG